MIHPNVELRFVSAAVGYGVFATAPLARGTITWTRCALDRTLTPEQVRALGEEYFGIFTKYAYVDGQGSSVLCWDHARYMNHSCAPTCLSPGFDFDIAVRDIGAGEELTCDYGMLNIEDAFPCACGEPGCRGTIHPDDGMRLAHTWDGLLEGAVHVLSKQKQLLWPFVKDTDRVTASADGREPVPSCRTHLRVPRATVR